MSDTALLAVAFAVGLLLGAAFFGGLWWTIRRGVASPRPALWFLGSLMLRMAVVLAGFYFVSSGRWERLLLCLAGFIAARFVVTRLTRPRNDTHARPASETRHAP